MNDLLKNYLNFSFPELLSKLSLTLKLLKYEQSFQNKFLFKIYGLNFPERITTEDLFSNDLFQKIFALSSFCTVKCRIASGLPHSNFELLIFSNKLRTPV